MYNHCICRTFTWRLSLITVFTERTPVDASVQTDAGNIPALHPRSSDARCDPPIDSIPHLYPFTSDAHAPLRSLPLAKTSCLRTLSATARRDPHPSQLLTTSAASLGAHTCSSTCRPNNHSLLTALMQASLNMCPPNLALAYGSIFTRVQHRFYHMSLN
jgi:hypothetical protein